VRLVTVSDDDPRSAADDAVRLSDRVAAMRRRYGRSGLSEADLAATWTEQFDRWFAAAVESGLIVEPNAMVLATATPEGRPSVRTVLLKGYDRAGFVFFTNYRSRKGRELAANPHAALVFSWVPLERQVVVTGDVRPVPRADSVSYFRSRPYGARLGAWASPQSAVLPGREPLDAAVAELTERWPEGTDIQPPEHWGGYLVDPETVEFWQGRADRLHDRLRYRRLAGGDWTVERLAP
jgi:pyridoxamine 5'-phosphate oxidase